MEKLVIYTDGSHFKDRNYIGYGAVCQYQDKIYNLSGNVTQKAFADFYGLGIEVSNPTAEMVAATASIREFTKCKLPVHIEIVADYIGVKEWCEHNWEAKKLYIREMVLSIDRYTKEIKKKGGKVTFRHIKGHQRGASTDAIMNNLSDVQAKSPKNENELKPLIEKINEMAFELVD